MLTSKVHLYGWAYEAPANRNEPCRSRIHHERQCREVVWDVPDVDGSKSSFTTFRKRARNGPEIPIPIAVASWKRRGLSSAADEL